MEYLKNIRITLSGILILASSVISCSTTKNAPGINSNKSELISQPNTIWGSSGSPFPGEKMDRKAAWKRLNDKIKSLNGGYDLQGHRSYDKGLPATWSASVMSEDEGLCKVSFGSIKPDWAETANGSNYQAIKKFVQSIPDDRIVYLTFHHEPEDNAKQKGNSPALLQAAFAKFVDAVLEAGKPNVHPCFTLMSYTFRPESGRNPEDFNMAAKLKPEQLNKVIAGLDGYAKTPATNSAKNIFEPCFTKMASWGFTRFAIFELATHPDNTSGARVKWINDLGKWVKERKNIEAVSWFNSGIGPHAGPTGWFLGIWSKNDSNYVWNDVDGSVAAYAQLLKP